MDELCYFTFAFGYGNTSPALGLLKAEASKSLCVLIMEYPEILTRVIGFAAQHMVELQAANFTGLLEASRPAFAKFVPDTSTAACIAALIARTQPPPLGMRLPPLAASKPTYDGALNKYLFSAPAVQLPQGPNAECIVAGCKLLEVIDWRLGSETLRMHMAVILLSARKFVSEAWYASFLAGSHERSIFAPPFDMEYIRAILTLSPKQFVVPDDVILLHVRVLLSMLTGMRGDSRFTVAWLGGTGFFAHLGYLVSRGRCGPVVSALTEFWPAFLRDPDPGAFQALGSLFAALATSNVQDASRHTIALLGKTIACDPGRSADIWVRLIAPHAPRSDACMSYLDVVLYYAFTAQDEPLVPLPSLRDAFSRAGLDAETTLARARTGSGTPCVWVAYAAALCGGNNDNSCDNLGKRRDALLRVGMSHQNDASSALVWTKFFEELFWGEAAAPPLPQEVKDRATKFFLDTAKMPAITADPTVRKFYVSLASWDRVAILTGPRFASEVLPVVRRLRPSVLSTFKPKAATTAAPPPPLVSTPSPESGNGASHVDKTDGEDLLGKKESVVNVDNIAPSSNERVEGEAVVAKSFFTKLAGMSTEERAAALKGLLPQLDDDGSADGSGGGVVESAAVDSIQRDMRRTLDDFARCVGAHEGEGLVKQIEAFSGLPIFAALKDGLERYANIVRTVSAKEAERLDLLRRMCQNSASTLAIPMSCRCGHAPQTAALQVTNGAPDAGVAAQLRANGQERMGLENAFVETARTVAYVLHLLGAIAEDPETTRTTAVCIFFGLLPLVLKKQFPQNSPPTSDAAAILLAIGREHVLGSFELQCILHKFLLHVKMDGKYPSITPVSLNPQSQSKSQSQQLLSQSKSQQIPSQSQPQQILSQSQPQPQSQQLLSQPQSQQIPSQSQSQQMTSTQPKKPTQFSESYKTIFTLYEPCVFVNSDNAKRRMLYFSCLYDVYKARNMNDEAKRELLKRFEVKRALASVLKDKEVASKLGEFFRKYASRPILTNFFTEYCVALITVGGASNIEAVLNVLVNFSSSEAELAIARQTVADPSVLGAPGFDATALLSEWVPSNLTLPLAPRFCALDIAAALVARCAPGKALKRALRKVVATALDGCSGPADLPIVERVFAFIGAAAASTSDVKTSAQALRLVGSVAVPRLCALGIGVDAVPRALMGKIPLEVKQSMWRGWKRSGSSSGGSSSSAVEKFVHTLREGPAAAIARAVCLDFAGSVDWAAYLAHLEAAVGAASGDESAREKRKSVSSMAVAVIRLGAAALAVKSSADVGRHIAAVEANWRAIVRPGDLAAAFDGSFFVGFVTDLLANNPGHGAALRSELSFVEALKWLAAVAEAVGSGPAVAGVAQEALAVSFMATATTPSVPASDGAVRECKLVLPLAEVDRILLDVQLGLCQYLASGGGGGGGEGVDNDDPLETAVRCVFTYCAPTEKDLRIIQSPGRAAPTTVSATASLAATVTAAATPADSVEGGESDIFVTKYEVDETYFDESVTNSSASKSGKRSKKGSSNKGQVERPLATLTKAVNVAAATASPRVTPAGALVGELRRHASEKVIGLVLQFPKQSVPGVALKFVSLAGISFSEDLRLCVSVLEESIRAYFTLATDSPTATATADKKEDTGENGRSKKKTRCVSGAAQVARALVPPASPRDFFAACVEARAALTASVLVEQLCAHGKEAEAIGLVARSISRFPPHQTYQADIVALWLAALSLAEDPEWTPERQEDLAPLRQIARYLRDFGAGATAVTSSAGGSSSSMTSSILGRKRREGEAFEEAHKRLCLAARAAHILYVRLTLVKSEAAAAAAPFTESAVESSLMGFKADEEELAAAVQQLRKVGEAKENKKYRAFFALVPGFRNQDYTVKRFKQDIAETLFPMEPYLKNI